jgi:hypothetical protein
VKRTRARSRSSSSPDARPSFRAGGAISRPPRPGSVRRRRHSGPFDQERAAPRDRMQVTGAGPAGARNVTLQAYPNGDGETRIVSGAVKSVFSNGIVHEIAHNLGLGHQSGTGDRPGYRDNGLSARPSRPSTGPRARGLRASSSARAFPACLRATGAVAVPWPDGPNGNAVTILPVYALLTTHQAAERRPPRALGWLSP